MSSRHRLAALAAVASVLPASFLLAPQADAGSPAPAAKPGAVAKRHTHWAKASKATITPGVMMYTAGAQCTANFVYTDAKGGVYVGYAAHCAGTGESTDTNGCKTGSVPLGTKVNFVVGGSMLSEGTKVGSGRLVYSSWIAMHRAKTKAPNTCAYNDLALVKVSKKDVGKVNPSVPVFGGPTGLDTNGTKSGDSVYSYGNSSLRGGAAAFSPHRGSSIGDEGGGWSHQVNTTPAGVPGDSGSGFLSAGGKALGVLSTINIGLPTLVSNGVGDLAKELAFARTHSRIQGLQLTHGTKPFKG